MDIYDNRLKFIANTYAFLALIQLYAYFFLISSLIDMLDKDTFVFIVVNEVLYIRSIVHRLMSHIIEFFNDIIAIFLVLFPTDLIIRHFYY